MKIIKKNNEFRDFLTHIRKKGQKIGLIPTMGSIHEGHLSLIKECQKLKLYCLVTIFVNPTQFNETKDFKKYPRNIKKDIHTLQKVKTDLLFLPSNEDLYPEGIKAKKTILAYRDILCDKFRPGHFDGVTTVVNSFFKLINPEHAFFGEKDFQQLKIIQKIIEQNNLDIILHPCKSIRMSNGMSYSSRYDNLSSLQKKVLDKASKIIMQSLYKLKKDLNDAILKELERNLKLMNIKQIEYLEIRNEKNLTITKKFKNTRLFIAFYIDEIRILDNFELY